MGYVGFGFMAILSLVFFLGYQVGWGRGFKAKPRVIPDKADTTERGGE